MARVQRIYAPQANHVTAKTKRRAASGIDLQLFKAHHKLRQGCLHYCGSAESGKSQAAYKYGGITVLEWICFIASDDDDDDGNVLNLVTHTTQYLYMPFQRHHQLEPDAQQSRGRA